jgi:hypothetical protein
MASTERLKDGLKPVEPVLIARSLTYSANRGCPEAIARMTGEETKRMKVELLDQIGPINKYQTTCTQDNDENTCFNCPVKIGIIIEGMIVARQE